MTTTSPNMGLTIPDVGVTPGPEWASDINDSFDVIDGHTHLPGSGVAITPAAININDNIEFNGHSATELESIQFEDQTTEVVADLPERSVFTIDGDLYFKDGNGNDVQITEDGAIPAPSIDGGGITGLVDPAAVVYNPTAENYTFYKDYPGLEAANIVAGSVSIVPEGAVAPTVKFVTDPASATYNLTLPTVLASSSGTNNGGINPVLRVDISGQESIDSLGFVPLGTVVEYYYQINGSGPTQFNPPDDGTIDVFGFAQCSGQTITDISSVYYGYTLPYLPTTTFGENTPDTGENYVIAIITQSSTILGSFSWRFTGELVYMYFNYSPTSSININSFTLSLPTGLRGLTTGSSIGVGNRMVVGTYNTSTGAANNGGSCYFSTADLTRLAFSSFDGNTTIASTDTIYGNVIFPATFISTYYTGSDPTKNVIRYSYAMRVK